MEITDLPTEIDTYNFYQTYIQYTFKYTNIHTNSIKHKQILSNMHTIYIHICNYTYIFNQTQSNVYKKCNCCVTCHLYLAFRYL